MELIRAWVDTHIINGPPMDPPTEQPQVGQARLQLGSDNRVVLWIFESNGWRGRGLSPILGTGNPQGVVQSDFKYQIYMDENADLKPYFATNHNIGATQWSAQSGGGTAEGGS